MADRVVVQADPGTKPPGAKPACPCPTCEEEWAAAATAAHGTMRRSEAGCDCPKCRFWQWKFRRALEHENHYGQRFQPFARDFEPPVDPQPTQASSSAAARVLARVLGRGR